MHNSARLHRISGVPSESLGRLIAAVREEGHIEKAEPTSPPRTGTRTTRTSPTSRRRRRRAQCEYFDNKDFTNLKVTRVDPQVNFNWGPGSPDPSIGADTFSVKWTSQVLPDYTQAYTFYTTSDDGVRLIVNGKTVIDKLVNGPSTSYTSSTVNLTAGVPASIELDYYDNTGNALSKLSWSSKSVAKNVIPSDHLIYDDGTTVVPTVPPDAAPTTSSSAATSASASRGRYARD